MTRRVSGAEMKEIDRRTIEEFGIPSLTLMENAGRSVAEIVTGILPSPKSSIFLFCGKGNNGGDGLVAARYLAKRHYPVQIFLFCQPSDLKNDPAINFKKLSGLNIPIHVIPSDVLGAPEVAKTDLMVDALFGVGLKSDLREPYLRVVQTINRSGKRVVAVDVPSGLDADTGEVRGVAVRATVTATLGLPKKGLYEKEGPRYAGQIRIVDIGIPKEAYE